jgi:hypothetical protein
MHLSERNYAVQLQTTSGDVLHFDDPGCFFLYEEHEGPEVHAVWFRHVKDDRWVSRDAVGFLEMASTPMDFGIGAVDGAEAGALTYEQARERALAKGHGPG